MQKRILSTFLALSLYGASLTLALDNPAIPLPADDAADEASGRNAAETAAAIKALGASPAPKRIAAIVFKAVRSSSESVLPIVDATVRVSPQPTVPEIVTAATVAVPNRWKKVIYRRLAAPIAEKSGADDRRGSGIVETRAGRSPLDLEPKPPAVGLGPSARGSSGPRAGAAGADPANGIPMTLAEAIIRTAFDAQPGLSLPALEDAVNAALRMDPANLIRDIQSPGTVSGVGGAAVSTYANEPFLTPNQPAVSR